MLFNLSSWLSRSSKAHISKGVYDFEPLEEELGIYISSLTVKEPGDHMRIHFESIIEKAR